MPEQCAVLIDKMVEIRKAKGMTQKELANACNLTQSVIARIESKKSIPQLNTFFKIIQALECTLSFVNRAG